MYKFSKEERLCSKKLLDELFHNGSSFLLYPFRVSWHPASLQVPVQVVISVPKRRYKHAVDRNLLKRRIREAYRLHKFDLLYQPLAGHSSQLLLGISYVGKEILEFTVIEKKLKEVLKKLLKHVVVEQDS